jgi:hypothetical protein
MSRAELPNLTPEQLEILRRFALFEANLDEVRRCLAGVFEFDFQRERRVSSGHFRAPEPGIIITREHISKAIERNRLGLISRQELVDWATMFLLNDAYQLESEDEDFLAEWLNDVSYGLNLP